MVKILAFQFYFNITIYVTVNKLILDFNKKIYISGVVEYLI